MTDEFADFRAERAGSIAKIIPLTPRATSWLRSHVSSDSSWADDALLVEIRYFAAIADAIIAGGFTFER